MRSSSILAVLSVCTGTIAEKLLYRNTFNNSTSLAGWVAEGPVVSNIANNTLELRGAGNIDDYFVYWLPEVFPDRIRISFEFQPTQEPGLAMFFFGATAVDGGSIFEKGLKPRNGSYPQYHSSDIRLLHASYFRRRWPEERVFHVANLRKSPGFNLVAQGADPLPSVEDVQGAYFKVEVVKDKREASFSVNGLQLFSFDDQKTDTVRWFVRVASHSAKCSR